MKISRNPLTLGNVLGELPNIKVDCCCLAFFKSPCYCLGVLSLPSDLVQQIHDTDVIRS